MLRLLTAVLLCPLCWLGCGPALLKNGGQPLPKPDDRALMSMVRSSFPGPEVPPPFVPPGSSFLEDENPQLFQGKRWDEVTWDFADRFVDCIHFMTPEVRAYYLPAFLLAALRGSERAALNIAETVLQYTKPRAYAEEWLRFLSHGQLLTLAKWLQRFADDPRFDRADYEQAAAFVERLAQD